MQLSYIILQVRVISISCSLGLQRIPFQSNTLCPLLYAGNSGLWQGALASGNHTFNFV